MSSKNSRVEIHVGRNQKFTSKNSRSKNSHGPIWVGLCGPVWVGLFCGPVFPSQNLCKVTENKRHPQQEKRLQDIFFCSIVI